MKGLITVLAALVVLGLAFFLYSSPAAPPEMAEGEIAQIEAEVTSVADQLMTALNNLDPGVAAALYDRERMHGNDGTTYYATYEEWVTHNEELFGRFEEMSAEWRNTRVEVLAPDAALFVGQNEMIARQVSGAETNIQGYLTLVLRKADGAWRIIHQASVGRWTPIE